MATKAGFFCLFILVSSCLFAQKADTTRHGIFHNIRKSKMSHKVIDAITHSPSDTLFNVKSEDTFKPYTGRTIRNIIIHHIGFDKTMYDTTRNLKNTVTKIGNALHTNTREWVIRDNLFIHEGNILNPYKLADNERYLRDLDFILDARITVKPVRNHPDMVDLYVVTRDVFSLGGDAQVSSVNKYSFKLKDSNLSGWGQSLQIAGLVQTDRIPGFGSEVTYQKSSVGGSLINISAGYTTLSTGSHYGKENEYALFFRADRPLVSPYSRLAGGMEFSRNWSQNVFLKIDSLFRQYNYTVNDFWIGYNIGVNSSVQNRSRHFVSIRTFNQHFTEQPKQTIEQNNVIYNDQQFVLGQITFFNQNFYKTRYIYGFGRTEDVPYGRNISLLTGYAKQLHLKRAYLGANIENTLARPSGNFYQYIFRAEAFYYKKEVQDISLLLSASLNSRLLVYRHVKIRQNVRGTYTYIINPTASQLLNLNNQFGVMGLRSDSLRGTKRLALHSETVFFTNWRVAGFRFAPVTFLDVAFLTKRNQTLFYDKPYLGLGGGVRTRNENLIFGTIEARGTYYPRTVFGSAPFKFSFSTNLRIKYTGTLVKRPDFVQYN